MHLNYLMIMKMVLQNKKNYNKSWDRLNIQINTNNKIYKKFTISYK